MNFCPFLYFSSEHPVFGFYMQEGDIQMAWLSILSSSTDKSLKILNKLFKNDEIFSQYTPAKRMQIYWTIHCFISKLSTSNTNFLRTFPFFILEQIKHFYYQITYETFSNQLTSLTPNMTAKAFEYLNFLIDNHSLLYSI